MRRDDHSNWRVRPRMEQEPGTNFEAAGRNSRHAPRPITYSNDAITWNDLETNEIIR